MKKQTKEEFIDKAKLKHGDRYDYSKVNYINNNTNVVIICKEHGEFEQRPRMHISHGCKECKYQSYRHCQEDIVNRLNILHNYKYDYSSFKYKSIIDKINLSCSKHGDFDILLETHLKGIGCLLCHKEHKFKIRNEEFIEKCLKIHNNLYDYSEVKYNGLYNLVKIICPKHGVFEQIPKNHLVGKGCSICRESKGELNIRKYLTENNIKFISQYKFDDCKFKRKLPFDFYLPEFNICIEFNGEQHYKTVNFFGGEKKLESNKIRDNIKVEYCKNNNIQLIVIKYDECIEDKLLYITTIV